jgi:hypothetical protein
MPSTWPTSLALATTFVRATLADVRRVFVLLLLVQCSDFKSGGAPDAGEDASIAVDGGAEGSVDSSGGGGDTGSTASCRPIPLPCLDPAPDNVIEVPSEKTAQQAFAEAKANDVIQIRGASLGAGWRIPAFVTLRGCAGAKIEGAISFAGTGGVVEGFEVAGSIVANQTGSYVVRHSRFVGASTEAGVSARAIDGLVSAQVTMTVESSWFETRPAGVEARTSYDTGNRSVTLAVRNSVFRAVQSPVRLSEGGLVGRIQATIEHCTFHAFREAIYLSSVSTTTMTRGNLFASGTKAVDGDSPFEAHGSLLFQCTAPTPLAGTFATGDPKLVDPAGGNFHLGPGSAALDQIDAASTEDYYGCPRPRGARADIGAIENQ